jgi:hypothetical protein
MHGLRPVEHDEHDRLPEPLHHVQRLLDMRRPSPPHDEHRMRELPPHVAHRVWPSPSHEEQRTRP